MVTAWLSTLPLLSMAAALFPSLVNIFFILVHVVICLAQDLKLGVCFVPGVRGGADGDFPGGTTSI